MSFCRVPSIQPLEDGSMEVYCPGLLVLNTSTKAVARHLLLCTQYHCQTAVTLVEAGGVASL